MIKYVYSEGNKIITNNKKIFTLLSSVIKKDKKITGHKLNKLMNNRYYVIPLFTLNKYNNKQENDYNYYIRQMQNLVIHFKKRGEFVAHNIVEFTDLDILEVKKIEEKIKNSLIYIKDDK